MDTIANESLENLEGELKRSINLLIITAIAYIIGIIMLIVASNSDQMLFALIGFLLIGIPAFLAVRKWLATESDGFISNFLKKRISKAPILEAFILGVIFGIFITPIILIKNGINAKRQLDIIKLKKQNKE